MSGREDTAHGHAAFFPGLRGASLCLALLVACGSDDSDDRTTSSGSIGGTTGGGAGTGGQTSGSTSGGGTTDGAGAETTAPTSTSGEPDATTEARPDDTGDAPFDPTGGECVRIADYDGWCAERGFPPVAYSCFLEDVNPACVQDEKETFLIRCCPG